MRVVLPLTSILVLTLLVVSAPAKTSPNKEPCLENNWSPTETNFTECDFHRIIDGVTRHYKGIIHAHGANLEVKKEWENKTPNAEIKRFDDLWIIKMYGGLTHLPMITHDTLALIVCHELGHHLAGFPFYSPDGNAQEGEADYFVTRVCARKVWGSQHAKNAKYRSIVEEFPKSKCDATWPQQKERDLCYRITTTSKFYGVFLNRRYQDESPVSFETPDPFEIEKTKFGHPAPQCRLDTFLAGALCKENLDSSVIPGWKHPDGQKSIRAEREAAKYSCTRAAHYREGLRPRCWFKPKIKTLFDIDSVKLVELSGNGNGVAEPNESAHVVVKIKNLAHKAYENVIGTMSSLSPQVEVLRKEVSYGAVAARSSHAGEMPFAIQLGALDCGEKLDVQISLGDLEELKFDQTIRVGKFVSTKTQSLVVHQPIPDNDQSGLVSQVNVPEKGNYSKAVVAVDLPHEYRGDVRIELISPKGKSMIVRKRTGGSLDDIRRTFHVALPEKTEVAGKWSLRVTDHMKGDKGSLKSWSLGFTKYVCE